MSTDTEAIQQNIANLSVQYQAQMKIALETKDRLNAAIKEARPQMSLGTIAILTGLTRGRIQQIAKKP
jgi:hypothetical protein